MFLMCPEPAQQGPAGGKPASIGLEGSGPSTALSNVSWAGGRPAIHVRKVRAIVRSSTGPAELWLWAGGGWGGVLVKKTEGFTFPPFPPPPKVQLQTSLRTSAQT